MDKHKELSFWIIFGKTLKSLFTRYDKHGSLWFRIRPLLFFGFLLTSPLFFSMAYEHYKSFSFDYPNKQVMMMTKGYMSPIEITKQSYYELVSLENKKILFESNKLFSNTRIFFFDKNSGERLNAFVQVRWFMLPSGKGWIVDLWIDGKQYVDEELSKMEFLRRKSSKVVQIMALVAYSLLLLSFTSEYRYVKNKLIKNRGRS